jgi:hypothetical protein
MLAHARTQPGAAAVAEHPVTGGAALMQAVSAVQWAGSGAHALTLDIVVNTCVP